ncbi:MAG: hypothetical protein HYZ58_08740 [Acidobacteria bacterium]|nr:hypothetical protein [Acidobacteriota bacterium]
MIRKSAAREVEAALLDLESKDEVRVETAIARLSIIGPRAAPHLLDYLKRAVPSRAKAAALRALEGCRDPAALRQALVFLDSSDATISVGAIGVARTLLATDSSSSALDRLTQATVDRSRPVVVRLAALDALADLPLRTLNPLLKTLQLDESAPLRARAALLSAGKTHPPSITIVTQAALGDLPQVPEGLARALDEAAPVLPLSVLHRLVEAIKAREDGTRALDARAAWTRLRGRVHDRLAARNSRIGLYDLRESVEAADGPLPTEFLKALGRIGHADALESLAVAYQRAASGKRGSSGLRGSAESAERWRTALLEAFQAIVRRERLTRRSPAFKRALARSPALAELWKGRL